MNAPLDPYHKWLGIPPEEQPPDHYRLLGVSRFESNPDVIENAADRQMAHLRSFQTGRHADSSQKLLNEVSTARLCLLDPARRAEYDQQLYAAAAPQAPVSTSPSPVVSVEPAALTEAPSLGVSARGRSRRKPRAGLGVAVTAVALGILLLIALLVVSFTDLFGTKRGEGDRKAAGRRPAAAPASAPGSGPASGTAKRAGLRAAVAKQQAGQGSQPQTKGGGSVGGQGTVPKSPPSPPAPPTSPAAKPGVTEPTPVPSTSPAEQNSLAASGRFFAVVKGDLQLFLNGRPVLFSAGPTTKVTTTKGPTIKTVGRSEPVRVKPGDVVVVRFRSKWVFRAWRLAFVTDDGRVLPFRRTNLRLLNAASAESVDAATVRASKRPPRPGRVDRSRRKLWADFKLASDGSEWIWGVKKNAWELVACVLDAQQIKRLRDPPAGKPAVN